MLKLVRPFFIAGAIALVTLPMRAQQSDSPSNGAPQQSVAPSVVSFEISGMVKAGTTPIPGVTVSAANSLTGKKVITSTDIDGSFRLEVPNKGKWVVRAELTAFGVQTAEVMLKPEAPTQKTDFSLVLLSRVPKTDETGATAVTNQQSITQSMTSGRGSQRLNLSGDESALSYASNGSNSDTPLAGMNSLANSADATNQSVSVAGQMGNSQDFGMRSMEDLRDRIDELRQQGRLGELGGGGFGGPGGPGGPSGPGGFGGGGPIRLARFGANKPHGMVYYSVGNGALDATPYSLTGTEAIQPDYSSNRFGGMLGGPLNIPHIYNGGTKTFAFINYTGNHSSQPYDSGALHVPTLEERQLASACSDESSCIAQRILNYIPLPNQVGDTQQNYRLLSSTSTNSDNISLRLTHNFGSSSNMPFGGPGGPGGPGGGRSARPHNNINFGGNYTHSSGDLLRAFGTTGTTKSEGWNINSGWSVGTRKISSNLRVTWNAQRANTRNSFAGVNNVTGGGIGIPGVSTSANDWGLPTISITGYDTLSDITPSYSFNQTLQIGEVVILPRKKHNVHLGADYRRLWTDLHSNSNPNGSYVFTGAYSGNAFEDFLLGKAQQTSIQYSPDTFHFQANSYDFFVQDDWRVRSNLTINAGLRYEYFSPYTEAEDRLVNLAVPSDFTAATAVCPTATSTCSATTPASLVRPDRNNFAPRVGMAWRWNDKMVLRAGYGINYNLGQYRSIVQQLAIQPPYSFTQTNSSGPYDLEAGFVKTTSGLTNNYAVNPDYRLGYVQMWNLNIQRELPGSILVNIGYTGSKGTALDMVRAPNRGPNGLRIAGVQAFLYESSQGFSILHSGSVRVRRRMKNGMSVGGTYTFSKSIDNASSIGGGSTVVAQNDLDLAAERGLSSFDQRHKFTGDWMIELPFGSGKRWLNGGGAADRIFGDWTLSSNFTFASGTPFTARVVGDVSDVARGTNGTLRADYNGAAIQISDRTVQHWFNTSAFSAPASGAFGNAGRNTIIGPGTILFNMSINKEFPFKEMRSMEVRAQVTNLFNHPNYSSIDTNVNSPTFGYVTAVGQMRQISFSSRFRF